MEICNTTHTYDAQTGEKLTLNYSLIKVFTNYVNTTSKWIFLDSDYKSESTKFDKGRIIHK